MFSSKCFKQNEALNALLSNAVTSEEMKPRLRVTFSGWLNACMQRGSRECKELFSFMVARNVVPMGLDVVGGGLNYFLSSLFSFACDFLDGDSSFEGCSAALLTGSHVTCRRSPRLLSNGYYVWTEDPFLCDKDGNITLSPPQASVLYKENLVR